MMTDAFEHKEMTSESQDADCEEISTKSEMKHCAREAWQSGQSREVGPGPTDDQKVKLR